MRETRILIDVDEVICDFVGTYLAIAGRHMGQTYSNEQVTQWCIPDALNLPVWCRREIDAELCRPGAAYRMPLLPGAKQGVIELSKLGTIVFVTAPYKKGYTWAADRDDWLHHHFSEHFPVHVVSTKYKTAVTGDIFIDDRPENLKPWVEENLGKAVVWDCPHNRDFNHPLVTRTKSWDELKTLVKAVGSGNSCST